MRLDRRTLAVGLAILAVVAVVVLASVLHRPRVLPAAAFQGPDPRFAAAKVEDSSPSGMIKPEIDAMQATCDDTAKVEPPAEDRPTPAEIRRLKGCSPMNDYYGVDGRRDLVRARKCAFVALAAEAEEGDSWGSGVLMMIYAKGEGVAQNLPYARRMACIAGYSAMDKVFKLEQIEAHRTDPKAVVDICEDNASGWLSSQCAYAENERRDLEREGRIARLQRGWPAARLAGWKRVVASRTALEEARVGNEIDISGTLRGAFIAREEARLRDFDEALLKDLTLGQLRDGGAAAREADEAMNVVYRQVMTRPVDQFTWPPLEDIRATQKVWLRHRDRWRQFAEASWPGTGDAVVARLTAARRVMLACHLDDPPEALNCDQS